MKIKLFIIFLLLVLSSCSKEKEVSVIEEKEIELQMIDAYNEGLKKLESGDARAAAKKFNEAELIYPQSEWAPKSVLMAAYSYYSQAYYSDAIFELERYIKTYPNRKNLDYAYFLMATCYYNEIVDEKKDLEPLLKAQKYFNFIIKKYPNTDFALDAKFKLDMIKDILASKEMYLAKHYSLKENWIPAINRYKKIIEDYDTTIYTEEALHRLVEIHYKLGLVEESKKYAKILGYNYQSSKWYKESYKVFNRSYKDPIKKIKKTRKKKLADKVKSLF